MSTGMQPRTNETPGTNVFLRRRVLCLSLFMLPRFFQGTQETSLLFLGSLGVPWTDSHLPLRDPEIQGDHLSGS